MALPRKLLPIVINKGLAAGVDPKLGAGLIKIENGVWEREGALSKRRGTTRSALTATAGVPAMSNPGAVYPLGDDLIVVGGGAIARYTPSSDTWQTLDDRGYHVLSATESMAHQDVNELAGFAISPTLYAVISRERDSITSLWKAILWVYDETSGNLVTWLLLYSGEANRRGSALVTVGADIKCYVATAAGGVDVRTISSGGVVGSPSALTSVAIDITSEPRFEHCRVENGGSPYVILFYPTSATAYSARWLPGGDDAGGSTQVIQSGITVIGAEARTCYARDATHVDFAWQHDAGGSPKNLEVQASTWDLTPTQISSPAAVLSWTDSLYSTADRIVGIGRHRTLSTRTTLYVDRLKKDSIVQHHGQIVELELYDTAGVMTGSTTNTLRGLQILTKPILSGASDWLFGVYVHGFDVISRGIPEAYWMMQGRLWPVPCGRSLRQRIATRLQSGSFVNPIEPDATGRLVAIIPVAGTGRDVADPSSDAPTINAVRVALTVDDYTADAVVNDGVLHLGGSLPVEIGADGLREQGFVQPPAVATVVDNASGSGLDAGGAYRYRVSYEEWADGRLHESEITSLGVLNIGGSPTSANIHISAHAATLRNGPVKAAVWRTLNNGSVYRRVAAALIPAGAHVVVQTDSLSDTLLLARQQLYTTGGVLEKAPPVPHAAATVWQGRHVVVDMEAPDTALRYSRTWHVREPFLHSAVLETPVSGDGGPIKALAAINDKLAIFKRARALVTTGRGLNDAGGGSPFSDPYLLSPSVGCVDSRVLTRVPQGVIFLAADGFWLLSGGEQLRPIGDAVRHYTDTYTYVRAVTLPGRGYSVFLSSDGPALVYDWLRDRWSQFTGHMAVDGAAVGDVLYRLDSSDYIWADAADSTGGDNAAFVPTLIDTGFASPAGLGGRGGLHQALIVGGWHGAPGDKLSLRVRVAYNNEPAWSTEDDTTYTIDALQPFQNTDYYGPGLAVGTYADQAVLVAHQFARTKHITSVRLEVSDAERDSDGPNAGISLSAIVLEVSAQPGLQQVNDARIAT